MLQNSGHLLPAGHRLLPEPDREGPACHAHPTQRHTHPQNASPTHAPHTQTLPTTGPGTSAPQPGTQLTAPAARLYTVGLPTYEHHTHPSHKHTRSHTQIHTQSHTKPTHYTLTHTNTLTYTHMYAHSFSRTYMLTFIPRHSQIPAPKSPHGPISAFCLPHSCKPQPHPACSPTPGPKTEVLVPESLSRPDHPFALHCSLEPKVHL